MSTLRTTNITHPSSASNNIVLNSDGSTTIATLAATDITATTIQGIIKSGTAVSASSTAVDFTGIPSWVKRITVLIADVSTNSTNACLMQFGSSGTIQTTNYKARNNFVGGNNLTSTSGFPWGVNGGAASNTFRGSFMCNLVDASTNVWVVNGCVEVQDGNASSALTQGRVTLSGTLDILRLQAGTAGTETFDAGTVNIIYEG